MTVSKPFHIKAENFCLWNYFSWFKTRKSSTTAHFVVYWSNESPNEFFINHFTMHDFFLSAWFGASPFESYCMKALEFDMSLVIDIPVWESLFLVDVHIAVYFFFLSNVISIIIQSFFLFYQIYLISHSDPDCEGHRCENSNTYDHQQYDGEESQDEDSCSEHSSSTSTSTNQKEGKYCDCCYCEFFGHGGVSCWIFNFILHFLMYWSSVAWILLDYS